MPRKESNTGPISAQAQQDLVSEGIENFELPKSIVTKIAKSAIPEHAKLQKETVLSLLKGSTVFINYLSATAHGVAVSKQHKSISATDVLKALELIEFGDLVEMLQGELQIYRENNKGDKGKKAASTSASVSATKGKMVDADSFISHNPSILAVGKSRGKEREKLSSPFTSIPRSSVAPIPDLNQGADEGIGPEDEDMEPEVLEDDDEGVEEDDEVAEVAEEDVEEEMDEGMDEGMDGEGDGGDDMVDKMTDVIDM